MRPSMLIAGILSASLLSGVAFAGEPAASTWYDSYGKTANDRAVALEAAAAQQRERSGGYGPGVSSTTIAGDYNQYQTYNGPVMNSSVLNSVNSNSTSVSTTGSTGVTVSVTTGQTSGTATQTGTSSVAVGDDVITTNSCSGNGPCN